MRRSPNTGHGANIARRIQSCDARIASRVARDAARPCLAPATIHVHRKNVRLRISDVVVVASSCRAAAAERLSPERRNSAFTEAEACRRSSAAR